MATPIIEDPNNFPANNSINVPDGTDARVNASAVVRGFVQGLADRTAWLKQRIVQLAADNALTGFNHFLAKVRITPGVVNDPALYTTKIATDAPNPSTNKWQHIFSFKTGGTIYAHVYGGTDGTTRGGLIITYNAWWDAAAGQWQQYETLEDSVALVWRWGSIGVHTQPYGSAPWTDWAI